MISFYLSFKGTMKIKKESNNNHIIKPSGNLSRIHKYKIWRWVIITRYSIFQNKISYKFVFTIWNDWNIFEQIFQAAANMYKKFKILIFSLFFFQFWLFFFLLFSSGFPKIRFYLEKRKRQFCHTVMTVFSTVPFIFMLTNLIKKVICV